MIKNDIPRSNETAFQWLLNHPDHQRLSKELFRFQMVILPASNPANSAILRKPWGLRQRFTMFHASEFCLAEGRVAEEVIWAAMDTSSRWKWLPKDAG